MTAGRWGVALAIGATIVGTANAARADDAPATVLATFGAAGLRVGDATLFEGAVTAAGYDRAQDLIWFVAGGSLQVVDLRAATPAAVVVAKRLPTAEVAVSGWSNAHVADPAAASGDGYPLLVLGKRATVGTYEADWNGAEDLDYGVAHKRNKKVKVVGTKWLSRQAKRPPREVGERAVPAIPPLALSSDWLQGACADGSCGELAGDAAWGEPSVAGLQVVAVFRLGADRIEERCALRDPATGLFASPDGGPWGSSAAVGACDGFASDPARSRYTLAGKACTIDAAGVTCAAPSGSEAFAWVDDVSPRTLARSIAERSAGRSVALTSGPHGLVARAADGTWSEALVSGPVDDAAYDAALDLVWLRRGGTLEVLDLRAVEPTPVAIVTGLEVSEVIVEGVGSAHLSPPPPTDDLDREWATLAWRKKPRVTYDNNIISTSDPDAEPYVRSAKKLKLVGKKWLAAQAKRVPRARSAAGLAATGRIELPASLAECRELAYCSRSEGCEWTDSDACGATAPLGQTGLLQVVVGTPDQCALYDPGRSMFASLHTPAQWDPADVEPVDCVTELDPTGTSYLVGASVCTTAGCADLGDVALGWMVP